MVRDKSLREAVAIDREEAETVSDDIFSDRVSIDELRKIWNDRNRQYTDDELYQIRDWLYVMAGAVVHVMENTPPETLEAIRNTKCRKPINRNALVFTDTGSEPAYK